jgi:hypothetical protein
MTRTMSLYDRNASLRCIYLVSLDLGRVMFIASVRVVTEEVFSEARREKAT